MKKSRPIYAWFWLALLATTGAITIAAEPPNVLFICIDDLRPQLGCYGAPGMVTPNLDKLASEGRLFTRQYVVVPVCGPSRFCMLTSQRPSVLPSVLGQTAGYRMMRADPGKFPPPLPQLFKQKGYRTVGIGKISHNPDGRDYGDSISGKGDGSVELGPDAWDEVGGAAGKWKTGWAAFFAYADGSTREKPGTPNHEAADVDDLGYPDGLIAKAAIEQLSKLKDQPFFLAVGFFKPHLPFNAPRKYWDLYPPGSIQPPAAPGTPANVDAAISLTTSDELTPRYGGLKTPGVVTPEEALELRRAYFAATSYTDAQVGKVLRELDKLGLREKTIVVVWGDHGYHLGDQGIWCKQTLHERALRSAFMMRIPGMEQPGKSAAGIVESIDIYPTLTELCGIETPAGVQGRSLSDLLSDPDHPGKAAAISQWEKKDSAGRSVCNDRYRLTVWTAKKGGKTLQVELYDHQNDPEESRNIAAEQPAVVDEMMKVLKW